MTSFSLVGVVVGKDVGAAGAWQSGLVTEKPPVEAIDRALRVLTELATAGPAGLTLAQLADRLGVNKTTVFRALAALRYRGFAVQSQDGTYALGSEAVTLGESFFGEDRLATALHPALVALSLDVDELVHLGVLAGGQIVYLDKVEPERPVRVFSAVGRRMPAATTALGRALLAARLQGEEGLAPYLTGLEERADGVAGALAQARSRGWASEWEENEPGIACVAMPLQRAGEPVAAVSVTAPRERLEGEGAQRIADAMRRVLPPLLPAGITLLG